MDDPVTRRTILATGAAALAGTSGCLAIGGGGNPSTATPTATTDRGPGELTFGQGFSENGVQAVPKDATVQHSVLYETDGGALDVHAADGRQYLFMTVQTGGSPGIDLPSPSDFLVSHADGEARATQSVGSISPDRLRPDDREAVYDIAAEREVTEIEGWLAFPVPAVGEFEAALLELEPSEPGRPAATWNLSQGTKAALGAAAPAPVVESVMVPDSVPAGEPASVSVIARNDGDGLGRLRLGLNVDGAAARSVRVDVPAGETTTWEGDLEVPDAGTVTVEVRSAGDRFERTVTVGEGDGAGGNETVSGNETAGG